MSNLNCSIRGIKKKGRCVYTRRDNVEVYLLVFDGKPITVDVKKLNDYLDFKADELGFDLYLDDENAAELEVLGSDDLMTA